jgi:phosphoribosyl-AMP cyclohydrolase
MEDYAFLFEKQALVPTIVQNNTTGDVLMLAYMNKESFGLTLKSGKCTFFSRSRQKLWCKGETSGHFMMVKHIYYDCDCDTLLIKVDPLGPACHTGNDTCFYREWDI